MKALKGLMVLMASLVLAESASASPLVASTWTCGGKNRIPRFFYMNVNKKQRLFVSQTMRFWNDANGFLIADGAIVEAMDSGAISQLIGRSSEAVLLPENKKSAISFSASPERQFVVIHFIDENGNERTMSCYFSKNDLPG